MGGNLKAGVTFYEFGTDTWGVYSIVNIGLLGAAAPAILAGIAVYGVADYMFGVGNQLDKSIGRKSTIWYL